MKKPFHKKMTSKAPLYIYATEKVSNYYNLLHLKNKRILSVVGSGDQIINAYFYGAKEVVGFDINKYSYFILEIKFVAIVSLKRVEFLKYFGTNMSNGDFNYNLYSKLKNKLSVKTRNFFDSIYKEFNYNGKKIIKSQYFRQRSMFKYLAQDINFYLKNDKEYLKCRNIIKNKDIKFYHLDINNISSDKELKGNFDIINLSNVLNYLTGNTKEEELLTELLKVTNNVRKKLKYNGLFFYYSYSPSIYREIGRKIPPASRVEIIKNLQMKMKSDLSFKRFKGIYDNTFDRINIFRNII